MIDAPRSCVRTGVAIATPVASGLCGALRLSQIRMMGAAMALSVGSIGASASEYGCTVLLCLANPAGPRAVAACVPPINRLFRDLARFRPFPTCPEARRVSMFGGRSWAEVGRSHYDACPDGTTPLLRGTMVAPGPTVPMHYTGPVLRGIGTGDELEAPQHDNAFEMPGKICVGERIGTTLIEITYGPGETQAFRIGVHHPVVVIDAVENPNVIDVYINDALHRRVRW